ncbi:hypothetical protein [uncultured Algimonas sp.]|uniref:hypothetical protein n=1 Tax=uncultured Algimonas sp. TaxID=1547920 RepID=UPI0026036E4A|nr:hypothetical protein [uncultured Algimonas sp.]
MRLHIFIISAALLVSCGEEGPDTVNSSLKGTAAQLVEICLSEDPEGGREHCDCVATEMLDLDLVDTEQDVFVELYRIDNADEALVQEQLDRLDPARVDFVETGVTRSVFACADAG